MTPYEVPTYTVATLPRVHGNAVLPLALNNRRDVVGVYRDPNPPQPYRSFFIDGEQANVRAVPLLPSYDVGLSQFARGISEVRDIPVTSGGRGVLIQDGVPRALPHLSGATGWSDITGISASGVVTGSSMDSSGMARAVLWDACELKDLGPGKAYAVNAANLAVGVAPGPQAFVFAGDSLAFLGAGVAIDINHAGRIVGRVEIGDGAGTHAFVYDWPVGPLRDVSPSASHCALVSVNAHGQAVGTCDDRAVVLVDDTLMLLDELVPDAGWSFRTANDINDDGVIVGVGLHGGVEDGFLAAPLR